MKEFPEAHQRSKRLAALLLAAFLLFPVHCAYSAAVESRLEDEVDLIKGDLDNIPVFDLTRVSITDPAIVDLVNIDTDNILVLAKQSGQTNLFIWDKYGKRLVTIHVFDEDLNVVKARLERLFQESDIKGLDVSINKLEGKVIISGEVAEGDKDAVGKLIEPFSASIMNLTKAKAEEDLIQIDAQIAELTSSYSKDMGFEWTSALTYEERLPGFNPRAPTDFLKVGDFERTTQILANVNALITEGKGRVLSKPKLVCVSGKEASFLVGGQIPITSTTTSSGGNVQEDVDYRDYGVNLTVSPTIRGDKIDINLNIDVSDIDSSNAVGNNVAFTTRTAQTQLFLKDGQTVVLAGLIKHNEGETVERIPILSDIPILGAIFRHRSNSTPETDTELVISLTPTILTSQDKNREVSEASRGIIDADDQEAVYAAPAKPLSSTRIRDGAVSGKSYVPAEMASYARMIQERIAQSIYYPEEAKSRGWEGTVKIAIQILNDGTLKNASVKESSGYDLFDEDALQAAKNLAPYSNFPPQSSLKELTFTVPIVYSLDHH